MSSLSQRRHRGDFNGMVPAMLCFIALIAVVVLIGKGWSSYNGLESKTLTVCKTERDQGTYRIYTDDGTYVLKDSLIGTQRYDTADAYGRIHENVTYNVKVKNWRIPFLSWFKNIVEFDKADESRQNPSACD